MSSTTVVNKEPIKVVFWDLDGTLWSGTLGEDSASDIVPHPEVLATLHELDSRGILNSLVTQAAFDIAQSHLKAIGLHELFVQPMYAVGSKARAIASSLTALHLLPINAAFIDDQSFHLEEVKALLPEVLVLPAQQAAKLSTHPRFQVSSVLGSSRRRMMQAEAKRGAAENVFAGDRGEFLQACQMILTCRRAQPEDMPRFKELLQRAHQFSANGPHALSSNGRFYIGELKDRYGDYGLVAAVVVEDSINAKQPICVQLAISCRVQGRGVVESFLRWLVNTEGNNFVIRTAITPVNRSLRTALRLCGFSKIDDGDNEELLQLMRPELLRYPVWMRVKEGK